MVCATITKHRTYILYKNKIDVPADEVEGLEIAVKWSAVELGRSQSAFPRGIGEYHTLRGATHGKKGGYRGGRMHHGVLDVTN